MTQVIDAPKKQIERSRAADGAPVDLAQLMGFDTTLVQQMNEIEVAISKCETAMSCATGRIAKAFAMAHGISLLRRLITDELVEQHIVPLMNTRLGFKTDKDPARGDKPYGVPIVKDCLIEALIRSARPIGNEFNIIAKGAYLTKEFFTRALGECPGVTDIVASPGVPQVLNGKTVLRFGLSWKKDGIPDMLKSADGQPGRAFEIRTDQYSSADQVVGKATRKAYAAAYQQVTGSEITLPEGDADESRADPAPKTSAAKDQADETRERIAKAKESSTQVSPPASKGDVTTQPEDAGGGEKQTVEQDGQSKEDNLNELCGGTWPEFRESLYVNAATVHDPDISREAFENGLGLAVMLIAKKTKEHTITATKRKEWFCAMKVGKFDFQNGRVIA